MIDPKYYYIPRYLNEPLRLTIFTLGEAIPALVILGVMLIAGFKFTGVILGAVWIFWWKSQKAGRPDDFVKRKLAWMGLTTIKARDSLLREFMRGE